MSASTSLQNTNPSMSRFASALQTNIQKNLVINPVTDELKKKIIAIAKPLIEQAQAQGTVVAQTHKKNRALFNGCKMHSAAHPNGSFYMFIKKTITPSHKLAAGSFKDMDTSAFCELTRDNMMRILSNNARLRFKSFLNASITPEEEINYHILLSNHPNIVQYVHHMSYDKVAGVQTIKKHVLYLDLHEMNLYEYINKTLSLQPNGPAKTNLILSILEQQLKAVGHVHSNHLVHNDISLHNFLITRRGDQSPPHVVLTDFGKTVPAHLINTNIIHGGLKSLSPEKLLQVQFVTKTPQLPIQSSLNHNVDIWALGIVLHAMINDNAPYPYFCEHNYTLNKFNEMIVLLQEQYMPKIQNKDVLQPPLKPISAAEIHALNLATDALTEKSIKYTTLVTQFERVSNPLTPRSNTRDNEILKDLDLIQTDFSAIAKRIEILAKEDPNILFNEEYAQVHMKLKNIFYSIARSQKTITARYHEVIQNTPLPSKTTHPLEYLLAMMLQIDSSKRISIHDALQVIEDYQLFQTLPVEKVSKKRPFENL